MVGALASADAGEEDETERQIIWSGTLTVGYADDDERMVTHMRIGGEVYGYNAISDGYGQLTPTHFEWRGQSVRVVVLGMLIDQEAESSVHVMLSHELPDYYELQIGGRAFRLGDATHPPPRCRVRLPVGRRAFQLDRGPDGRGQHQCASH